MDMAASSDNNQIERTKTKQKDLNRWLRFGRVQNSTGGARNILEETPAEKKNYMRFILGQKFIGAVFAIALPFFLFFSCFDV